MTGLKHELNRVRHTDADLRYESDLAADIGVARRRRLLPYVAAVALAAAAIALVTANLSEPVPIR